MRRSYVSFDGTVVLRVNVKLLYYKSRSDASRISSWNGPNGLVEGGFWMPWIVKSMLIFSLNFVTTKASSWNLHSKFSHRISIGLPIIICDTSFGILIFTLSSFSSGRSVLMLTFKPDAAELTGLLKDSCSWSWFNYRFWLICDEIRRSWSIRCPSAVLVLMPKRPSIWPWYLGVFCTSPFTTSSTYDIDSRFFDVIAVIILPTLFPGISETVQVSSFKCWLMHCSVLSGWAAKSRS